MAHKPLIDATGYSIVGGKPLIDGTAYKIIKGRELIDGTGYNIWISTPVEDFINWITS